ncbi:hypothetical protein CALCODRAFT_486048 [Calocera cornea HHB12733]|uniref:Uncharacterized protein n=1 Tax=Calocera cornea HHB12733 TaxID=1353952 RepID=A0A165DZM1_9BASI|nr:hypothetical protein CALCODRAFT_486048 [Calocera cornea HHB12733]
MQLQNTLALLALLSSLALPAQAAWLPFRPTKRHTEADNHIRVPNVQRLLNDPAAMTAECELVGLQYVDYGLCGEWAELVG